MSAIVLCYHKVGPLQEIGRWLNVEPQTLRSHVRFFLRNGHRFVRGKELDLTSTKQVVLTFDDCYLSTFQHGLPILKSEGVHATFFAVSGRVGGESSWDSRKAAPLANWSDLLDAQAEGMEVGNHTATHKDLSLSSGLEIASEWGDCDDALKARGLEVATACYPYGKGASAPSHDVLRHLGYRYCFALGKRLASPGDSPYSVPRIIVSCGDKLPMLLYKMHLQPKLRRAIGSRP